jgi:hypothetical protein
VGFLIREHPRKSAVGSAFGFLCKSVIRGKGWILVQFWQSLAISAILAIPKTLRRHHRQTRRQKSRRHHRRHSILSRWNWLAEQRQK